MHVSIKCYGTFMNDTNEHMCIKEHARRNCFFELNNDKTKTKKTSNEVFISEDYLQGNS